MTPEQKKRLAGEIISRAGRLAVAFSGGVDSSLLLALAARVLGPENVLAVTGVGPLVPARELARARETARALGVAHVEVPVDILALPDFVENRPDRCYVCKTAQVAALARAARDRGFPALAHGANADDSRDYRPGLAAAAEAGVLAPLAEAGLAKAEIRRLARKMGLSAWNLPSAACLASRIPHGDPVTLEKLSRIEKAEDVLRDLGAGQCRVRLLGDTAVIEVLPRDMARLMRREARERIARKFTALGFSRITLDLAGYRTGSLNPL